MYFAGKTKFRTKYLYNYSQLLLDLAAWRYFTYIIINHWFLPLLWTHILVVTVIFEAFVNFLHKSLLIVCFLPLLWIYILLVKFITLKLFSTVFIASMDTFPFYYIDIIKLLLLLVIDCQTFYSFEYFFCLISTWIQNMYSKLILCFFCSCLKMDMLYPKYITTFLMA